MADLFSILTPYRKIIHLHIMYKLTLKINIIDTTIPTPEQEEEVNLFLEQCEKWGAPWV